MAGPPKAKLRAVALSFAMTAIVSATPAGADGALSLQIDKPAKFRDQVLAIDAAADGDGARKALDREGLLGLPLFVDLSVSGAQNIGPCIAFLSDPSYSARQKLIASLSLHELGKKDYVLFVRKLVDLYKGGQISRNLLLDGVMPGDGFTDVEIREFDDPDVRKLLIDLQSLDGMQPGYVTGITSILSGKAWVLLQEYRAAVSGKPLPFFSPNAPEGSKQWRPPLPQGFPLFSRLFRRDDLIAAANATAVLAESMKGVSSEDKSTLARFLDAALATDASDEEWQQLWKVWNPEFELPRGLAMRDFVRQIRDLLERAR